MATTPNQFGTVYNSWPVFSQDDFASGGGLGFEGAQKRFTTFPQPAEVLGYALLGLPKVFPLTGEAITPDDILPFLNSAIAEIEMSLGMNISPVQADQSFDILPGMFEANYTGMKLQNWPATQVQQIQLRFPHTQTAQTYATYTIPPSWVALRRNRVNVIAGYGSMSIDTSGSPEAASAAGIFSYIAGFARGAWQPAALSVQYVSGFDNDRLPTVVADLIKTWAAWRFMSEAFAPLFPTTSVNVSIDGVSQSATFPMAEMMLKRVAMMEKKKEEQVNAVTRAFGRTIKMAFV